MTKENKDLNLIILSIIPVLLIITGFIIDKPGDIISGLYDIVVYPDILLIDYLVVGDIGATFVNSGLVTLMSLWIVYRCDMEIDGLLIAAILTVAGFSFIGKNIVNTWPIFIGTVMYARCKGMEFRDISVQSLFATTLAPAVSQIAFGLGINYIVSIPIAIITGIAIGFIVVPLANHMVKFHDGYSLYNMGFVGGIIGTLITSLLKGFGYNVESQFYISTGHNDLLRNLLILFFSIFIIIGFLMNNRSFKGYRAILKQSGRGATDFVDYFGFGLAYINVGILGLISVLYVILVKGIFNGPVVAGILTVAAFASCGKHPKNCIPILIGAYLAAMLMVFEVTNTSILMAALFGTTLAPIAGCYGVVAGIIAGFLHVSIVSNVGIIHGGLNLYNNGFSGGIVAAIMVPILQVIFNMKDRECRS